MTTLSGNSTSPSHKAHQGLRFDVGNDAMSCHGARLLTWKDVICASCRGMSWDARLVRYSMSPSHTSSTKAETVRTVAPPIAGRVR